MKRLFATILLSVLLLTTGCRKWVEKRPPYADIVLRNVYQTYCEVGIYTQNVRKATYMVFDREDVNVNTELVLNQGIYVECNKRLNMNIRSLEPNTTYTVYLAAEGIERGANLLVGPIRFTTCETPPTGYTSFYLDRSQTPERLHNASDVAGEYRLRFAEEMGGYMLLTLVADASSCDNGNAPLPVGEYTLADGTVLPDSEMVFGSPYWKAPFDECAVEVGREGDTYTIVVTSTGTGFGHTRKVWMKYVGDIVGM